MKNVSETYITKEEASQRKPAELYHIWRDDGEHWYYTSGDTTVTYDGHDYLPATLKRASAKYDSQLEATTMEITLGYLEEPVTEFIANNPIEILWIDIRKLFRDQSPFETVVIFLGQIKKVSFQGNAAKVICVGFEHFLKMPIPVFRYQLTCNHKLFDDGCGIDKAAYKITTNVTLSADKTKLTSSVFESYDDGYFIYGSVEHGAEYRMITDHVGDTITIAYKMYKFDEYTDSVDVYPGCDRQIETCRDKYDNVINFLGFPFIPQENPATRMP